MHTLIRIRTILKKKKLTILYIYISLYRRLRCSYSMIVHIIDENNRRIISKIKVRMNGFFS